MQYKKEFHTFQQNYIQKYPGALKMREYLPVLKNKSILDVGCGSGIDIAFFSEQGANKIAGVDVSMELVEIAKELTPRADIRNEDFAYLSFENETFDVVWSKYAVSCVQDITTPLNEIARVCKKDGIVLIQVMHPIRTFKLLSSQNYFNDGTLVEYPFSNGTVSIEPHHTISSWVNVITESGFKFLTCEEGINRPMGEYGGTISPSFLIFVLKKII